jgi:F-type H+-transporting ATPase subunit beta
MHGIGQLVGYFPKDAITYRNNVIYQGYPCIDPRTCRSRLLETKAVGDDHAVLAERVKQALMLLLAPALAEAADQIILQRASKLANSQPFFCAEPWAKRPGSHVSLKDSLQGCREILDGVHDDLPVEAFCFTVSMEELRAERSG